MAKLTILSFSTFMENTGDDLFKNLTVPDGIDKETLTDNILLKGAEFEVLYSDPYFMQEAIGTWSKKWQRTMEKWAAALAIEYEPLENYDRHEDWTDTATGSTSNTSHSADTSSGTGSTNTESKTSGYDSETYEPDSSGTSSSTNSNTASSDASNTGTSNNNSTHSGRLHGNIGVTTSQQMLQSELDIAAWNVYEHLTDIFLSEFVIPIY